MWIGKGRSKFDLSHSSEKFLQTRTSILHISRHNIKHRTLEEKPPRHVPLSLTSCKEFMLEVVAEYHGDALPFASPELQADPVVVRAAIGARCERPEVLELAPPAITASREFMLETVRKNAEALNFAHPNLQKDPDVVLAAMSQRVGALHFACGELKRKKAFMLRAVRQNGQALQFGHPGLIKNDPGLVQAAVDQDPFSLQYATPELQSNKKIVWAAVSQDGRALQYASSELQDDRETVWAAVSQDGRALQYASPNLRANRGIVRAAVSKDGRALQFASSNLQANKPIVKAAVSQDGRALQFACSELQNDDGILSAVDQNDAFHRAMPGEHFDQGATSRKPTAPLNIPTTALAGDLLGVSTTTRITPAPTDEEEPPDNIHHTADHVKQCTPAHDAAHSSSAGVITPFIQDATDSATREDPRAWLDDAPSPAEEEELPPAGWTSSSRPRRGEAEAPLRLPALPDDCQIVGLGIHTNKNNKQTITADQIFRNREPLSSLLGTFEYNFVDEASRRTTRGFFSGNLVFTSLNPEQYVRRAPPSPPEAGVSPPLHRLPSPVDEHGRGAAALVDRRGRAFSESVWEVFSEVQWETAWRTQSRGVQLVVNDVSCSWRKGRKGGRAEARGSSPSLRSGSYWFRGEQVEVVRYFWNNFFLHAFLSFSSLCCWPVVCIVQSSSCVPPALAK